MDFCGGILANKPPHYSEICMGEERELNETCSSGDSRYLYGKIIQVMCPSCYGGDLVKTGLVIARFYCTFLLMPRSTRQHHYRVLQPDQIPNPTSDLLPRERDGRNAL